MRQLFVSTLLLSLSCSLLSQKQNNNWLFGDKAGLSFNTSTPTPISGSQIALEGTSTISDADGQLLFYTDGISVWDANHSVMPNGTGLLGGASSTQAALIVPLPGSTKLFYLFTTENESSSGRLVYSIVDMSLNGGSGDVVLESKNTILTTSVGEKLTAILHADLESIWILTHERISNNFLAYLITSGGLMMTPVISSTGAIYMTTKSAIGPLKPSHNGRKIVSSSPDIDVLELFDFDNQTGILSNAFNLLENIPEPRYIYGVEFSPNDSLLYLSSPTFESHLFQLDLYNFQVTNLFTSTETSHGSLLLGPDNQIYIAKLSSSFLDIIEKPNIQGADCNYISNAIPLEVNTFSLIGLPNLAPYSLFPDTSNSPTLGMDSVLCLGDSLWLDLALPLNCFPISYLWNDGSTTSTLLVDQTGKYWVDLITTCGTFTDTIQIECLDCHSLIHYDLDSCTAYMSDNSHLDFSEFIPSYSFSTTCGFILGSNIFRVPTPMNKHSCTQGINDSEAMCVNVFDTCIYIADHSSALLCEILLDPEPGSVIWLTGLSFYEKGPSTYNWIDGDIGPNNYPTKFGIRILKNGSEVYRRESVSTNLNWFQHYFNLLEIDSIMVTDVSVFLIEWFAYCPVSNNATVSAWDIDEISIYGACSSILDSSKVTGKICTNKGVALPGVELLVASEEAFENPEIQISNALGEYIFSIEQQDKPLWIKGYSNQHVLNGVNTLDLLYIQRHLLGFSPFTILHQLIAADINNSGDITTMDLIDLRKAILGIHRSFRNNTSWRFGQLPHNILDLDMAAFREIGKIIQVERDTQIIDFVGIKIGDLNGSINHIQQINPIEKRSSISLELIEEKSTKSYLIHFRIGEEVELSGLQFAVFLGQQKLKVIESPTLGNISEHYSFDDGILKFSWSNFNPVRLNAHETILTLSFDTPFPLQNLKKIKFDFAELQPEVYFSNLQTAKLDLGFPSEFWLASESKSMNLEAYPVGSALNVKFFLPNQESVEILILDELGRCMQNVKHSSYPGFNYLSIDISSLPSGIYYCQLRTNILNNIQPFTKLW